MYSARGNDTSVRATAFIRALAIVAAGGVAGIADCGYAAETAELSAAALEDRSVLEIAAGVCAGGAFLAAYEAATTTAPVAATGVGTGVSGMAIVSAAVVGCSLGLATAAVSYAAASGIEYLPAW
jgi:hypothetical protein